MKPGISLTFFLLVVSAFSATAQGFESRKTELNNPLLIKEIRQYNAWVKTKATEPQKYIITLKNETRGDTSGVVLGVAASGPEIEDFNPSLYTTVDNMPVLIRNSAEKHAKTDTAFIYFLKTTYWKEGTERAEAHRKQVMQEFNERQAKLPDSIKVWSAKAGHAVMMAKSGMRPVIMDPESLSEYPLPEAWTLIISKGKLISQKATSPDNYLEARADK